MTDTEDVHMIPEQPAHRRGYRVLAGDGSHDPESRILRTYEDTPEGRASACNFAFELIFDPGKQARMESEYLVDRDHFPVTVERFEETFVPIEVAVPISWKDLAAPGKARPVCRWRYLYEVMHDPSHADRELIEEEIGELEAHIMSVLCIMPLTAVAELYAEISPRVDYPDREGFLTNGFELWQQDWGKVDTKALTRSLMGNDRATASQCLEFADLFAKAIETIRTATMKRIDRTKRLLPKRCQRVFLDDASQIIAYAVAARLDVTLQGRRG